MYGYIFEVTNNKTGETYIGKRYAVSFDKHYLGETMIDKLAVDIEKYGRPAFSVKMLMPFDTPEAIDEVFASMQKPVKAPKKQEEKKVEEPVVEEKPVEEVKPKKGRKKKVEE